MPTLSHVAGDASGVDVFRRPVLFCVLPADLARHHDALAGYYEGTEGVEIVVERRRADRRATDAGAPGGAERRSGDRRRARTMSAAEACLDLPPALRRHADRIRCVWRSLPVRFQDAARESDVLFAAAVAGDEAAREELRLRHYHEVWDTLAATLPRRRVPDAADETFEDLFAGDAGGFRATLSASRRRANHR